MQTFLPFPDFAESAAIMDSVRLNKQITETYQIMQALLLNRGYIHHSAVDMWTGHELVLLRYQEAFYHQWANVRGKSHISMAKTYDLYEEHYWMVGQRDHTPPWLGEFALHRGMQSNLVRKQPEYYQHLFPGVPNDIPYTWYTSQGEPRQTGVRLPGPTPIRGEIHYLQEAS